MVGIRAGTGSVFSILPPKNATDNWIKIVQRLPVRVALEPEFFKKYSLRVGLSLNVTIDIRDTSGEMLTKPKILKPVYQTHVYADQEVGVLSIIRSIIYANKAHPGLP